MPTARRLLVEPAEGGVFHCFSRCVRRAYLCGWDKYSGRDFEHRRDWVRDRVLELANVFAVDVYAYSVMPNHLHVILGLDLARARGWTDAEVARRWLTLFPGPGGKRGQPPNESAILALCQEPGRVAQCRERLADLSWFMRCLNEPIARRANREDECTGRFWEGRFKCQRLEDEGALLTCMAYVDLNPVRAGMAASPEESPFTSGQDRTIAARARRQLAAAPAVPTPAQEPIIAQARAEMGRDRWLVRFGAKETLSVDFEAPVASELTRAKGACGQRGAKWLSDMKVEDYLELLDWTGRELRADKRGRISDELAPILQRLDLDVEAWAENVARYGGLFHRLVGKLDRLRAWARAKKRHWLHGHRGARLLYAEA
ncbi:MAG: transposase [Verrucomicrobiales bacterium]